MQIIPWIKKKRQKYNISGKRMAELWRWKMELDENENKFKQKQLMNL